MTTIKSLQDALDFITAGRNPKERQYANNTRLYDRGDYIGVEYHGNEIVQFFYDGHTRFDSCGWRTLTTKERLNWFLPLGFHIHQERGVWYLTFGYTNDWVFADGLEIDSVGNVYNAASNDMIKEVKALTKRIKKYVDGYVKALCRGEISAPDSGDCWYCVIRTDSGESLGEATKDTSHILSHFDESYYVPSMLINAHKFSPMCEFAQGTMACMWNDDSDRVPSDWELSLLARDVKASLTKYLKKQFGIAS